MIVHSAVVLLPLLEGTGYLGIMVIKLSRFHFDNWIGTGQTRDNSFHLFSARQTPNNDNLDANATAAGNDQSYVWTWMDGKVHVTKNTGSHNTYPTPGQIRFGAYDYDQERSIAEVGEFILYKGMLSDTDRQKIEGYLGKKWGIYMDAGHPYTNENPYLDTGAQIAKNRIGGTVKRTHILHGFSYRIANLVRTGKGSQLVEHQFNYRSG